jgi:hypothetical protein
MGVNPVSKLEEQAGVREMTMELKILAVPMSTEISDKVQAMLAEKGVVVLRSDTPELVRLVTPTSDIDLLPANEFMWAALDALAMTSEKYSEPDADKVRRKFVKNLSEVATRKRRKLIGWTSEAKPEALHE